MDGLVTDVDGPCFRRPCSLLLCSVCLKLAQYAHSVHGRCHCHAWPLWGDLVRYLSILHCIQSICQNNVTADFNPSMDEREGAPEHSGLGDGFWKRCQLRVAPRPSIRPVHLVSSHPMLAACLL